MARTQEWAEQNKAFNEKFSHYLGNRLAIIEKPIAQVAREAGVTDATVYKYRAGKTPAMFEGLKILRACGVETLTLAELVGEA